MSKEMSSSDFKNLSPLRKVRRFKLLRISLKAVEDPLSWILKIGNTNIPKSRIVSSKNLPVVCEQPAQIRYSEWFIFN